MNISISGSYGNRNEIKSVKEGCGGCDEVVGVYNCECISRSRTVVGGNAEARRKRFILMKTKNTSRKQVLKLEKEKLW